MQPILFSALLVLAPAPDGPRLADGFYEVLESGDGVRFPGNDGRTLILGKCLGKKFGTPTIRSVNNDNTRFGCTLKGAEKLWDGPAAPALVLVAGRVCLTITGNSIPHPDETRDLWFTIIGRESAERVAKALHCAVQLRKDPGHRLKVKWTPGKEAYQVGEVVTLKFELTNAGKESVTFRIGGSQRGPRDNQFRFVAQRWSGMGKGVPDTGDPTNFGGMSWTRTLKPGETYTADVPLDRWFKFDEPDTYRVTGIWGLHLEDPTLGGFDPAIWDDLVCGDCLVHVEKAKK
jgi:hypothetical protein